MKRVFNFLIILVNALVLLSCHKEFVPEQKPVSDYKFAAGFATDDPVKTSVDSEGSVSWIVGDQIKLIYELGGRDGVGTVTSNELTSDSITEGIATFGFSTEDDLEDFNRSTSKYSSRHLYAVYPASIAHDYSTASSLYITVPTEQDGSFAHASISLSKWAVATKDEPLYFKNLCGLLKLSIADNAVRKIVLEASSAVAGEISCTFSFDGAPLVKAFRGEGAKTINVNVSGAGTYYIAVLPGTLEGFVISLYDENDGEVGHKISGNNLVVSRGHITPLGAVTPSEGYYVKVDGVGDGSSWDTAAGLTGLTALLKTNVSKDVYIAAGTYEFSTNMAINTGTPAFRIFGGFPADATGTSLSGRDIDANATIFDGQGANRILVIQYGNTNIDGITFQNAKRTSNDIGSALIFEGKNGATLKVNKCKFIGNQNTGTAGGGAVRVNGDDTSPIMTMKECSFFANTATKAGGAIGVGAKGTLVAENCLFGDGTSANANKSTGEGGGAIYSQGVIKLRNCSFLSNTSKISGGAIKLSAQASKTSYIDNCYFNDNKGDTGANHIYVAGTSVKLFVNNSVLRGRWGESTTTFSQVENSGKAIFMNSTILSQIGGQGCFSTTATGTTDVINCIVLNASGTRIAFTNAEGGETLVQNSLYSLNSSSAPATIADNCVEDVNIKSNFPTTNEWYGSSAATAKTKGTTVQTGDIRVSIVCYEWSGQTNAPLAGVNHLTLTELQTLITSIEGGATFISWLGDNLTKDIRGKDRNIEAFWPGSYEDAFTDSSRELKLMSYNILVNHPSSEEELANNKKWDTRKVNLLKNLKAVSPDVIGSQENSGSQVTYILSGLSGYQANGRSIQNGYVYTNEDASDDEMEQIYTKDSRVRVLDWGTFWLSNTPDTPGTSLGYSPRACTWAKLRHVVSGKDFYVYNSHIENDKYIGSTRISSANIRKKMADVVLARIAGVASDYPVFWTGDFNTFDDTESLPAYIAQNGMTYARGIAQTTIGDDYATINYMVTSPSGRRADYVFVNDKVTVNSYTVDTSQQTTQKWESDHNPIIVFCTLI